MYCILITGIPAAGKSTMAKLLGKELGLPVISKDSIKEKLFDNVGFRSREEKVKLGVAAMDIMYYTAGQLMQAGLPFILENNFETSSREGLQTLLNEYGYRALTVTLTGDCEIIYRRYLERNTSPDRHRGHVVNDRYPEVTPRSADELAALAIPYESFLHGTEQRGFDSFSMGEQIRVDVTDFALVDTETLIEKLRIWCGS